MRSCFVEIDKTVGTEWPPESVLHRGTPHSLGTIYGSDLRLDVRRGDGAIPLPATGGDFDLGELHALMLAHRRAAGPGWRAHVLVVPKKHIATLNELSAADDDLVGAMVRRGAAIAKQRGHDGPGFRSVFNCNAQAGQTVFHIHLHVLGGRVLTWPPG